MRACICLLLAWAVSLGSCVPLEEETDSLRRITRQQPIFGITHLDIRDAILALDRSIKAVANKLDRHEAREAQLAATTTKTLGTLSTALGDAAGGVQAVARQLAVMEERLLSLEALTQTTDERQRMMLGQITQGLDRLLAQDPALDDFPPPPGAAGRPGAQESAVLKVVKKLNRKMTGVETMLERDMRAVTNEVKIVGESLGQHMGQLQGRHDRLETQLEASRGLTQTGIQELSQAVATSTAELKDQVQQGGGGGGGCGEGEGGELTARLQSLDSFARQQEADLVLLRQDTQRILDEQLGTLQNLLQQTQENQAVLNASVADLTQGLHQVNSSTQGSLGRVTTEVLEAIIAGNFAVKESITGLAGELQDGNTNIMDVLDDRASQTENLQHTVLENYSDLSAEINSLKKVEQVMIHTADSVLDTKRSIEFGIQQIILELGEIVKSSGSTINSTLSDQISNISFAILKNQTSALTNMTAKMEQEISQVWRQIGIMYQQMSQSVDLLDQLKDTTKEHMNASLSRVGNMDGTVGKINTKVADVEDNLNYLLGRLSLVSSEFNLMKDGVRDELVRLWENMAKENNNTVAIEGGEPSPVSAYNVNRKRETVPVSPEAEGAI